MRNRKYFWGMLVVLLSGVLVCKPVLSAERDADEAASAAQADSNDVEGRAYDAPRPAKMPDLTKGEPLPPPGKGGPVTWNMGATGIIGIKNGGNAGDQVQVISVVPGSPADGKVFPGDVLLGVQGEKFKVGGDINWIAGNAIIKAEEEAGKGILKIDIWRDRNWVKRAGPKDVFGVDVDQMFKEAEAGSADVYEWESEEEKTQSVKQMAYDKFPIDGFYTNITLQLSVMGTYSDTSPWNCPVVEKVRENALKVIAAGFKPDKTGRRHGNWPGVLALVASGKPEYISLAKEWVHTQKLCQDMEGRFSLADVTYRGMQSWHHGFDYLEMAIYYDATHDDFVLPEIRKHAILAALGQSGGGSWGHTFAFPEFNGGLLHKCNPGYGGMNNAGSRCFFLLALAKKFGIEHPEINAAIARSTRFFGTYVDKGCIPYGDHSPWPSDDSNGKNYGVAYAFYTLGRKYEAKYFSMCSSHASFSRRGGHGSPTLWYYTPLSANIGGPRGVMESMRNMRCFYTLSRRHDGSFVFLGEQAPGIGGKGMRDPTATVALHLSAPMKQLIITGKDADEKFWFTDEELKELLVSARAQVTDPVLLEKIGRPMNERSTDELIDMLDHFYPNMRRAIAAELGKRFVAGEKDISTKVLLLLNNDEARMRDGACLTLSECGTDVVLENLSKVVAMLKDDAEFVRMTAARTIGKATEPGDSIREVELLKAAADDYEGMTIDLGNVKTAVKDVIFAGKKRGDKDSETLLTSEPFKAGYDEDLVRAALERIVTMDPQGTIPGTWSKETLLKLAGPVVFAADERQINDAMFGGARRSAAQALLRKHGYREAVEGDAANLRKRSKLERGMRRKVGFKDPNITPALVKKVPGLYREFLDDLRLWLQDNPTLTMSESTGKGNPPITTPLNLLIEIIEKDTAAEVQPSIWPDVEKMFRDELAQAGGPEEQLKLCRKELEDLDRKNFFRKMSAISYLSEKLGVAAIDDVSPFLGHEQWRLDKYANEAAMDLVKKGAGARLIELYQGAQARESGLLGNRNAAGILAALADAGCQPALPVAKAALKHHDPVVRKSAVQAVFKLGGGAELKTLMDFMCQAAEPEDFEGCEMALLSKKDDSEHVKRVSSEAIALLPKSEPPLRRSLAWLLGQFGGTDNLAAVEKAALESKDENDLKQMVLALAYSPDKSADNNMLALSKSGKAARDVVADLGVHRMVGRNGMGDRTDKERVLFAREVLNLKYDNDLISFLGRVCTADSMQLLFDVMKKGRDSTGTAVQGIIECAEGIQNPSKAESALAADVLAQVVEYIEVNHLRGGFKEQVKDFREAAGYAAWQSLQARAGQALLRFHKPTKAAIPEFNDRDLDF